MQSIETIEILLDNVTEAHNWWIGGTYCKDPSGVKVNKTDKAKPLWLDPSITSLQTWYYDYGWYSGPNIDGPFTDQETVDVPNL